MHYGLKRVAVFALAALIAAPLCAAQDGGKKKKDNIAKTVAKSFELPEAITLTSEQQAKLDEVKKEFEPKVTEVVKKQSSILTPEQKKLRAETTKAARAAGKKGKQLQAEVTAALKLTDEQQKQQAEVAKELKELNGQVREKISDFLTAEQKVHLKTKKKKDKTA